MNKNMTSRNRFLTTIEHKEPDRVPTFVNLTEPIAIKLAKEMNLHCKRINGRMSERISYSEILNKLGNDAVGIRPTRKGNALGKVVNGNYFDELGFVFKKIGYYYEIIKRPLENVKSIKEIEEYKMPNPIEDEDWSFAHKQISKYGKKYCIIGDLETTRPS